MALQVWNGSEYVGAELGRFGPTGTLKEALIWDGTQYIKVWPSAPPAPIVVTPVAPTFLEDAPWVTLPTVEGVDYTVVGTPGDGQTATVIATAQQGYALEGVTSWDHTWVSNLPVVEITGTSFNASRTQFHAACTQYGVDYKTVETLPFSLDTSQATALYQMFRDCSGLKSVPEMDMSNVTDARRMFQGCTSLTAAPVMNTANVSLSEYMFSGCTSLAYVPDMQASNISAASRMFENCQALTDGNVRCIGKHPSVTAFNMIIGSGLTREPWYDAAGNPI